MRNWERVLVIAAHPDDEVLGMGGAISRMTTEGITVDLLIVTDGSSSQYKDFHEKTQVKSNETIKSNELLGINDFFHWNYPDMRLSEVDILQLQNNLNGLIKSGNYDTIFSQSKFDVNKDHQIIFDALSVVLRPYPENHVKTYLTYYVNSSTEWGIHFKKEKFHATIFMDISEHIDTKLLALGCYETELRPYPHPRSLKAVKNSAEYFGNIVGLKFAEPFEVIHDIW